MVMHPESKKAIDNSLEKVSFLPKGMLHSEIDRLLAEGHFYNDVIENSTSLDASGLIEATIYFDLMDSEDHTFKNGIYVNDRIENFVSALRDKMKAKIESLNANNYLIKALSYKYCLPSTNTVDNEKYTVISKRSLLP